MINMVIDPENFYDNLINILCKAQCVKCKDDKEAIENNYYCKDCYFKYYTEDEWFRYDVLVSFMLKEINRSKKFKYGEFYYRFLDILNYELQQYDDEWDMEHEFTSNKKEFKYVLESLEFIYSRKKFVEYQPNKKRKN